MGIFDILFGKKEIVDTVEVLEKDYLNINDNSNIYGFQDKFYKQSERLLNVYGSAKTFFPNRLRLIVITDTHNMLKEEDIVNILSEHSEYDLCLLLGDHSNNDIEKIIKYIPKEKIYALLGNHDYNYIDNYGFNNLNGNIFEVNGVKIMGIQGSFKYKPVDFPSFTQEESIKFLKDKESVDVLFSHDGPFDDDMINNPAHQGMFGITYYLYKNKVKYNIHGHLHEEFNKQLLNGTTEMCLYMLNYIELE